MKQLVQAKKLLLFLVSLLIVGGLIWWWSTSPNLWKAIPPQTAIVLEVKDFWQKDSARQQVPILEELTAEVERIQQFTQQNALLIALQQTGFGQFSYLYIAPKTRGIRQAFATAMTNSQQTSIYRNQTIYRTTVQGKNFTFTFYKNRLLIAVQSLLVERAIDELKDGQAAWAKHAFVRSGTTNRSTIYLHLANLETLLRPYWQSDKPPFFQELRTLLTGLQLHPSGDSSSVWRGEIAVTESTFWQQVAAQSAADRQAMQNVLPDRTELALVLQFTKSALAQVAENSVLHRYFSSWMHGQLAVGTLPTYATAPDDAFFAILKIANEEEAQQQLDDLQRTQGELQRYDFQLFTIRQLVLQKPLRPLLGESLSRLRNPYFTTVEDYLIFCNSKAGIEQLLNSILVSEVLANAAVLQQTQQALPAVATLWLYAQQDALMQSVRAAWQPSELTALEQFIERASGTQTMVAQIKAEGQRVSIEVASSAQQAIQENATLVRQIPLVAEAITAPQLFPNGQAWHILVQDAYFNLHCFSQSGASLWTFPLNGKLQGNIQAIDYYKNGQQQYVFNTTDQLFVVNAKGEEVGNFSLLLQAATGVEVVDFDQTKAYNFFVPSENGNIYGFDKLGRPLPFWNPLSGIGPLSSPLQHFQHNGRDFILLATDTSIQLRQRDGQLRFPTVALEAPIVPPVQFQASGDFPRIVAALQNGKVLVIGLDGGHFHLPLQVGQQVDAFVFTDIWGDNRKDYVTLYNNTVQLWSYDAANDFKRRWAWSSETAISTIFATSQGIGLLCPDKQQIFLLNEKGKVVEGFPLAGTSPFQLADLYQNGKSIAVVAKGEVLLCYQLP